MSKSIYAGKPATLAILAFGLSLSCLAPGAPAQGIGEQPVHFRVDGPSKRLEMIVNTSRMLTLENNVPRIQVMNPELLGAQPISPNQIQVSARKPGVTQLNLWDSNERLYSVDVVIFGDARELDNVLKAQFPDASLKLSPLPSSVVISGYVPRAEMVGAIVRIAEDFYPKVINNMTVGGVQQILLHVKVMEVSRTKLRKIGFDWSNFNFDDGIVQNVAGLVGSYTIAPGMSEVISNAGETLAFGIVNGNNSFFGFLEALRQYNLVKVLAEPTLVTVSGRPASFNSGGEFPILVPQSLGTVSVEYRQFGTRVDFLPIVLGNGSVRLEVRPTVSEIDPARSVTINNITVPGLRTRWVDTAVEMKAGQTLALAGLIQNRVESENRGLPWVSDLPWIGAAFRRVEEQNNEVELLITVTPEFIEALDPHEVPPCGPGEQTTTPSDCDLYWRGYLEVPKCCGDSQCRHCQSGGSGAGYAAAEVPLEQAPPESLAPPQQTPVPPPVMETPAPPSLEHVPPPAPAPDQASSRRGGGYPQPAAPRLRPVFKSLSDYAGDAPLVPAASGGPHSSDISINRAASTSAPPDKGDNPDPGFLGPIGYDLLK